MMPPASTYIWEYASVSKKLPQKLREGKAESFFLTKNAFILFCVLNNACLKPRPCVYHIYSYCCELARMRQRHHALLHPRCLRQEGTVASFDTHHVQEQFWAYKLTSACESTFRC